MYRKVNSAAVPAASVPSTPSSNGSGTAMNGMALPGLPKPQRNGTEANNYIGYQSHHYCRVANDIEDEDEYLMYAKSLQLDNPTTQTIGLWNCFDTPHH